MSGSLNKVIIIGNLGRDPEIRSTNNGTRIANLAVATSENWTDRASGEKKSRTEWHRVSVMNDNLIPIVERFLRKGSRVYIEGQMQTRKYTDQQGVEKFSTEIVVGRFRGEIMLLDERAESAPEPTAAYPAPAPAPQRQSYPPPAQPPVQPARTQPRYPQELNDEIPF